MKSLFTKTLIAAAVLTLSSAAFADIKALNLFNAAFGIGAEGDQFMSQIHVSLASVQCDYSVRSNSYACSAIEDSGREDQGKELAAKGAAAEAMFEALTAMGAPIDNAMGHAYVGVQGVACKQAIEEVMDGTPDERTICHLQLEAP